MCSSAAVTGGESDFMPAMVSEAKKALLGLFAVENIPLWYVCHPPPPGSKGKKPPSAKTYTVQQFNAVADSQLILTPVLEEVRVGVEDLHNSSFWAWFVQRLLYDLTSGLVHTDRKKSEVEIHHDLLTPLLSWASHYAHITLRPETVNSEGETSTFEYSSAFELEPQTEWRPNTRGRNPQVDFALVGCVDGKPIYEIAVEAKAKLSIKDMSQLAQYMATLVNGIHTKPKTTVGLLLDQDTVQFAFSALCLPATNTPLSIVLVSPPLRWRSGTAVDRGVCIALCLLQKLTVKRVSVDEVKWKQVFGEELWGEVERVAKEIEEEGFLMQQAAASSTVPYKQLEDIEMLRNEVIMLRREVSKLQVQASPIHKSDSI